MLGIFLYVSCPRWIKANLNSSSALSVVENLVAWHRIESLRFGEWNESSPAERKATLLPCKTKE